MNPTGLSQDDLILNINCHPSYSESNIQNECSVTHIPTHTHTHTRKHCHSFHEVVHTLFFLIVVYFLGIIM